MKKVDVQKKVAAFNTFRQQNQSVGFERVGLYNALQKIGFNYNIVAAMCKHGIISTESVKGKNVYYLPKNPLYKGVLQDLYNEFNSSRASKKHSVVELSPEQKAINFLKSLGYTITKEEGIDENLLVTKFPEIYKQVVVIKTY